MHHCSCGARQHGKQPLGKPLMCALPRMTTASVLRSTLQRVAPLKSSVPSCSSAMLNCQLQQVTKQNVPRRLVSGTTLPSHVMQPITACDRGAKKHVRSHNDTLAKHAKHQRHPHSQAQRHHKGRHVQARGLSCSVNVDRSPQSQSMLSTPFGWSKPHPAVS